MKPLRIALAIFFSLLLIFIITVAVLFLRTDPKKIFSYFSEQIAASVFLQLKAENVKFDILKGIELSNVQVINVQTSQSNMLATFDQGRILYNPISLLWSKVDILNASVSGIRTTFDDLQRTISNINEIVVRSSNQNASVGVIIRSIAVENSEMTFNGILFHVRGGILFAELMDDSVINAELDSKVGSINVKGNLNRISVNLKDLQVGKIVGLTDTIILNSVRGKAFKESDSVYRFSGDQAELTYLSYTGSAVNSFSGKFDIAKNELSLGGFDLRAGKSQFHVDEFRTSTVIQDLSIALSGITAELSDIISNLNGSLTGSVSVNAGTAVWISAELSLSNMNFGFIQQTGGNVRMTSNQISAELTGKCAAGDFRADISCSDIFCAPVNVKASQDRFDIERILQTFARKNVPAPEGAGTNNIIPITNTVNLTWSLGMIQYKKMVTGKADVRATAAGRGIRLDEARVDFLKGALLIKGSYEDDSFTGEAALTDGKMKEFTALFLDSGKKLFGTVGGKAKFRVNMKDPLLSSGDVSLSVKDGEIKGVFIQNRISTVLFDIPLDDIFFDSIILNGKMENGQLNVNSFNFDSDNIRLNASGQVRLKTWDLSLRSEISFTKDYLSGLPNVAQIFTSGYEKDDRIAFSIIVNGPVKDPVVKIEKTK